MPDQLLACLPAEPFLQQPLKEVEKQLHTYALSHFLFAKAVVPR